ncbi:hypothetical protein BKA70DRAFT_1575434 [Coprinopsis sp. MPI-PUGE-AT-0042]|nr:hypothetical protein BKA70DRAFT_1575434 [Coprinopsis sp. MPI-PUGE-AT-0042]
MVDQMQDIIATPPPAPELAQPAHVPAIPVIKASLRGLFKTHGELLDVVAHKSLRMREQAFVSFDSPEIAKKAMADSEVQRFPLHGKPMAISFARTRSDAVVKKVDADSFDSHKERRLDHKKTRGIQTESETKGEAISFRNGRKCCHAQNETPAVQMPDEYLPPNRVLFFQNLPESVTKDQLMSLFSALCRCTLHPVALDRNPSSHHLGSVLAALCEHSPSLRHDSNHRYPNLHEVRLIPTKKDNTFVKYLHDGSAGVARDALHNFKLNGENMIKITFARK